MFGNWTQVYQLTRPGMKPELLFEAPFTDIHHEGVAGVFGDGQGRELITLIKKVNEAVMVN